MILYDPWVYCKWGALLALSSLIPSPELIGVLLFMFGAGLALIDFIILKGTKDG